MSTSFSAIPTEYQGRTFRSRLEATFAQALTHRGVAWEYEPKSFLLANGIHYWPDFYLPEIRVWVECRGYESEKGEAQLEGFAKEIPKGDTFLIVRPGKPLRFVYSVETDVGAATRDAWLRHRARAHLAGYGKDYDALTETIRELKVKLLDDDSGDTLAGIADAVKQRANLAPAAKEQSAA